MTRNYSLHSHYPGLELDTLFITRLTFPSQTKLHETTQLLFNSGLPPMIKSLPENTYSFFESFLLGNF